MLKNVSFWLWDNSAADEGLKVFASINYNHPTHKEITASMKGAQTHSTWQGYNRSQPDAHREFFAEFKRKHRPHLQGVNFDWWASKFVYNDRRNGPVVMPGAVLTWQERGVYSFSIQLQDRHFTGDFDPDNCSVRQRTPNRQGKFCIGAYRWSEASTPAAGVLW